MAVDPNTPRSRTDRRASFCISAAIVAAAWIASTWLTGTPVARAQDDQPIWGQPRNLSETENASVSPAIACDPFGSVHAFWSEKVVGEVAEFPGRDVGDSIYYRQLRDGEWAPAVDVAFAGQGESFVTQPVAGADRDGSLYLVWSGYRGIYFSRAPVATAAAAAAWSPAELIAAINPVASFSGPVKRPRLVVDDAHQSLHVIYSLYGTNGNLYYLRSRDMGRTWDEPRALTDETPATGASAVNANARIVLDPAGSLHVIWDHVVLEGESWLGRGIRHQASSDNGDTWSAPADVALPWEGTIWWGTSDIVAAADRLHVVFACGERPRRCYTVSTDGGETWTQHERLFGDYQSLAGWDSLTLDMHERVHLIAQLRDLESRTFVWHAALGPAGWPAEPSQTPLEPAMADHFPESCISLGNELHFVMAHESQGEIWHLSGELYPQGIPASALPDSAAAPAVGETPPLAPTVAVADAGSTTAPGLAASADDSPPARSGSTTSTIVISVLPALLLVAGSVLYMETRKRRR